MLQSLVALLLNLYCECEAIPGLVCSCKLCTQHLATQQLDPHFALASTPAAKHIVHHHSEYVTTVKADHDMRQLGLYGTASLHQHCQKTKDQAYTNSARNLHCQRTQQRAYVDTAIKPNSEHHQ